MAKTFTKEQTKFFQSKEIFHVGIAHEYRSGSWSIYGWEDYKLKKQTRYKLTLLAVDDLNEELTVNRKDLDDGFIRIK